MVESIREFGFKIPCLVRSSGEIVDGHLRLKAAKKLGMTEVPVILCDEWTPAQVKAFRLIVNRSVTWADWDEEALALELQDLREANFDLSFRPAENAELVLQADDVHVADVEEIGGAQIGRQVLLLNLEANHFRILVATFLVVH